MAVDEFDGGKRDVIGKRELELNLKLVRLMGREQAVKIKQDELMEILSMIKDELPTLEFVSYIFYANKNCLILHCVQEFSCNLWNLFTYLHHTCELLSRVRNNCSYYIFHIHGRKNWLKNSLFWQCHGLKELFVNHTRDLLDGDLGDSNDALLMQLPNEIEDLPVCLVAAFGWVGGWYSNAGSLLSG